ncbi:hypothetical protein L6164_025899 [Bauhinia variegata]|uniref:Uncharacterized protein n=1 Tax=Bauhinia variegata TaxID=167791 RepID=A0ACB9M512_BAUVA|nr:hypothetical protein L6164_025899 [Bauhinia variegata]
MRRKVLLLLGWDTEGLAFQHRSSRLRQRLLGCCLSSSTSLLPAARVSAAHGFARIAPHKPSLPENEDGCKFGKIDLEEGMGPVRRLKETLKFSRVLQLLKFEGMVPVRKLWEREVDVCGG